MRATMRITWLLLSLSFLLHSFPPGTLAQSIVTTTGGTQSGSEKTTDSKPTAATVADSTTGAPPTRGITQALTTAKTTAAVTTPSITVTPTSKPTDKPDATQPQASAVAINPPTPSTSISGAASTVVTEVISAASTPSPIKTTAPTATGESSSSSVVSHNAATTPTPKASETTKPSVTVTSGLQGNPGNVGTTKITKVSSDTPSPGKQTQTTITSSTSQVNSQGGPEKTTVTYISQGLTSSGTPEPAGNTGTTSTPSTSTNSGSSTAKTLSTTATTTSLQITTTTTAAAQPKMFLYSLNKRHEKEEEKDLVELCRRLMANLQDGNCTLTWWHHNGKVQFDYVEINGKVKTSLADQYYEEITKKPTDNKTLIAILASCGALLIMIVILAVCASHHRKPFNENQQHLTEELHTVENGYHDNPTLDVMEVQPEMQEKKMALNGEFNDSWIVPIDNLLKDVPDEEDTHL